MLKFFNRLEKTRNFVLLIFAILMVGSLVFFYTPARDATTSNLATSSETVASVSGEEVTAGEVVRQQENESRYMQGRGRPAKSIVDGLISSRIMRLQAEDKGLTASDAEVAAEIRKQFTSDGKPFDKENYEQTVTEQFGSVATYEQGVRDDISTRKLSAFLTSGVTVSEEEVLNDFQRKNTKFDLSYVPVNATDLAKKIAPTDGELREYFDKNKLAYYINNPQKKIKYVFINTSKMGEKLNIAESDLRAEYDNLPADKKIGGVLGQEIVLRVDKPEYDTQVLAKGNELVQQLRTNGPAVSEETFAELAKGQSENPATALSGGKLSGPVRENPNKTEDPYQQLLKMKPGEVSAPISYKSRYFILRRGEDVPKPYETAKKEIEISLRNRRAYAAAAELSQKVVDSLKETKDPMKTAQAFAGQANMSVADMIKETGYVKPGDDVPNIGVSPQFEAGIEPLANVGDVGDKTPIQNGFAIPILVDKKEPRDAEFDEVKDQIIDVVKLEKARSQVEQIAKAIAAGAASAGALGAAATSQGMEAKEQKNFVLGSPLGEGPTAGTDETLENAIYAMKAGDVSRTPLKIGDNWYVVGVNNREDANMADFAKQRTNLMEQMVSQKRSTVFADFLSATRLQMEKSGLIRIYKEVLDKLDSPMPGMPGLPDGMPGLPAGLE
jgi:peptidyl-prolyl cis-trans isomerase D